MLGNTLRFVVVLAVAVVLASSLPQPLEPFTCPIGHFKCFYEDQCILQEKVCDGYPDCLVGEDEFGEGEQCCQFGFKCTGRCLAANRVCDGWYDCGDQSDENQNCTGPRPTTCSGFFC